ncbi:MAG: hypothetical protein ABJF25_01440 [Rhodopirellula bahusiensis]
MPIAISAHAHAFTSKWIGFDDASTQRQVEKLSSTPYPSADRVRCQPGGRCVFRDFAAFDFQPDTKVFGVTGGDGCYQTILAEKRR